MSSLILKASILTLLLIAATAFAQPHVCGLPSGSALVTYNDSQAEFQKNVSPVISSGIGSIATLPDIRGLLAAASPTRICVTAIAVGKNIYQYDELLAVLTMSNSHGTWVTPMLYQMSSVQAYDNIGPKPWVGASRIQFDQLFSRSIKKLNFTEIKNPLLQTPLSLATDLLPKPDSSEQMVDPSSRGYVFIPNVKPGWSTYLISQLRTPTPGANLFSSFVYTDTAVIQIQDSTGRVRWASYDGFQLVQALQKLQESTEPAFTASETQRVKHLLSLSSD